MNNNPEFNVNDFTLGNDGQNGNGGMPTSPTKHAKLSLVTGILSLVIGCCCIPAGIILGVVAVALAFADKSKVGSFSPLAVAGAICGAIGIVMGLAMFVYNLVMLANGGMDEFYAQLEQFLNEMSNAQ